VVEYTNNVLLNNKTTKNNYYNNTNYKQDKLNSKQWFHQNKNKTKNSTFFGAGAILNSRLVYSGWKFPRFVFTEFDDRHFFDVEVISFFLIFYLYFFLFCII
jgi:hypothetical protein